ncbi:sugar ABC transporter substrate-binding protein [Streptomyces sp. NPDC101152]|uniref:sugar ABC transporter substrate-binding protein n=1 Tax=Streptomyces sp. NPDC101152 TaxID=3366116 RepID=UPI00382B1590
MRHAVIAVAVPALALSLASCGTFDGSETSAKTSPTKGDDVTVGLLLPDTSTSRYDRFDYPIIKNRVAELTRHQGKVEYANAEASGDKQYAQMQKMIDDKVDVILLDAVDSHAIAYEVKKAKAAGIPVIAYDRLAEGPIDADISFDNELVGEVQARSLLKALGPGAGISTKIVMINGSPMDPNAKQFKEGALSQLKGTVTIAKSYDTADWDPQFAQTNMTDAINAIGKNNIAGVLAADDDMAGGVIKALKAQGVTSLPPVTGQDATLDAVQRIVSGEQYMSVYKSYSAEAENAAEMAITKIQGKDIEFDSLTQGKVSSPTNKDIPSQLVPVVALTKDNIKDTVIADGLYKLSDICTAKYESECAAIGLK